MRDILVLGAGVVGMATAYALLRQGFSVTVIDAAAGPAEAGASFGNGAQLSYFYTDAMASPSLVTNLPKYMLGLDPAFRIRPGLSPAFIAWGLKFLLNSTQYAFERNTLDILKVALESRPAMREIAKQINFDYSKTGKITLYPDDHSLNKAKALADLKNQFGAQQTILLRDHALEKEPALKEYGHDFFGAVWSPYDEAGDSRLFCINLQELLERDHGVKFRFGSRVRRLLTRSGALVGVETDRDRIECSRAVVALGASATAITRTAGIRLPIWPVQGYSFTVPALAAAPIASITDTARKTVFCRIGDRLRVAGLADIGEVEGGFREERFNCLLETAKGIFPRAGNYGGDVNAWTGFRPMTPDSKPIVGKTKVQGVYLNCGHGSLGWTLSMATANRLADLVQRDC
ncbi:FAD-dependent oxidoreductase [Rhizobium anhuiense]|uniref:FAD-dependent oxidoreductase n=1 Tax=Rhizobium anhuiense TaxID=1184720 RepID=UPI0020CF59BC|nr:FAD-dependent oxidoreductase [Rhizobium anhuiense]UTS88879.1 FAD-dependent oxidoreductase [Rhizobium anhuiense bv. trifolii]